MKWFKITLDGTILLLISTLLFLYTYKENEQSLPNSKYLVEVTEWNHKYNKQDIFNTITKFAEKEHIAIYKVMPNYQNKKINKDIYVFNPTQQTSIHSFNSTQKYNYINEQALIKRDVKGDYIITDHLFNDKELKGILKSKGVTIETYHLDRVMMVIGFITEMNLTIPIIALLLVYLLYYIYDKNIHFKEYAVKALHGYTLPKMIFENFGLKSTYWIILFIIQVIITNTILLLLNYNGNLKLYMIRLSVITGTFILIISLINLWTYLILLNLNIANMIKGELHFKTIRLINTFTKGILLALLAIVIIQNMVVITDLNKIKETEKYWKILDDYYAIEFAPSAGNEDVQNKRMIASHQLIKDSEKHNNTILVKVNNPQSVKNNYSPYEGNVMFVNQTFWKLYNKYYQTGLSLPDNKNMVEILLPNQYRYSLKDVKKEYQEWFHTLKDKHNKDGKLNISLTSRDNYHIFSFNNREIKDLMLISAPIIINVQSTDLWDDFYYAMTSQGGYLFKDYDALVKSIKKYNLENDVSGVTNYKDIIMEEYRDNNIKLVIYLFSEMIIAITTVIIIIFDVKYYFDQNKKRILIEKIHGYSPLRSNYKYLWVSNLFLIFVGLLTYYCFSSLYLMPIFSLLIVFQLLLQLFTLRHFEKQSHQVIKEL
ncbi:DUF1430 domain-containing protein [Staphylococcus aureus]